jgi:hypothetical protein
MKKLDNWQVNNMRLPLKFCKAFVECEAPGRYAEMNYKVPEGELTEILIHSKTFVFGEGFKI